MNQPFYPFTILAEATRYDFLSDGKEIIPKTVIYFATDIPDLYSLTLADIRSDHSLDIYSVSDNGDMHVILSTVLQTIQHFLEHHPNVTVGFKGSTNIRTRLYQIAIAHELDEALKRFKIWGIRIADNQPELFRRNIPYQSFFITLKNI